MSENSDTGDLNLESRIAASQSHTRDIFAAWMGTYSLHRRLSRDVEVTIEHDGRGGWNSRTYHPFASDPSWPRPGSLSPERRLTWRGLVQREDTVFKVDGEYVTAKKERERVRDRVLKTLDPVSTVFDPSGFDQVIRPLIPTLMNHNTAPAFVGPKGWGKTEFVCPLCATLIIPGHRFLKHLEPVQMTDDERARDIWLLNSETHPGVIHKYLLMNGLVFGYREGVPCYFHDYAETGGPEPDRGVLIVEHLVMTSATEFDLTDESQYDVWVTRVIESARTPPLMVIADGVTAMLGNNTTRYGAWASKFSDWRHECDIPNGLGVLHSPMGVHVNTPMNGIESMGQWDGIWIGSSTAFPIRPSDPRYFETFPRIGDPRVDLCEVVIDDDGLLLGKPGAKRPAKSSEGGVAGPEDHKEVLLDRLGEAHPEKLWTRDVCPPADNYKAARAALDELFAEGKVTKEKVAEGNLRGVRWGLSDAD
jgi:hypothetical protein